MSQSRASGAEGKLCAPGTGARRNLSGTLRQSRMLAAGPAQDAETASAAQKKNFIICPSYETVYRVRLRFLALRVDRFLFSLLPVAYSLPFREPRRIQPRIPRGRPC